MAVQIPLNTATSIRRRLSIGAGQPVEHHQITYVIRRLGIKPVGRAGQMPVYSDDDVSRIGEEIKRIAARRSVLNSTSAVAG